MLKIRRIAIELIDHIEQDEELVRRHEPNEYAYSRRDRQRHLLWMLRELSTWDASRTDKAQRWLGFIQGVLWADHHFTIDELKEMNKP